jgi:hypothetical protein
MGYRRKNYVLESAKHKIQSEIIGLERELADKRHLLETLNEIHEMIRPDEIPRPEGE